MSEMPENDVAPDGDIENSNPPAVEVQETTTGSSGEDPPPAAQDADETDATNATPDYEFSSPEGFEINERDLDGYKTLAREAGLTQDQFSKITDYGLKFVQSQLGDAAAARTDTQMQWRQELVSDRTISDGERLKPDIAAAVSRVIDQYGGNDLRAALNLTGAGDNPAIVRAFIQIGSALGVAAPLDTGRPGATSGKSRTLEDVARDIYKTGV